MKILITGSEGLIGRWVVRRMLEDGHTIRTLDRGAQKRGCDWEHFPGDIRDIRLVRTAVQGMDAVIHLAAIPSNFFGVEETILSTNIQGTMNVLIACDEGGVQRLVNYSSINALGHNEPTPNPDLYLPLDDDVPHYVYQAYNLSKHVGEEMCKAFANRGRMVIASLRPTMVVAPDEGEDRWWRHIPEELRLQFSIPDLFTYVDARDVSEATAQCLTAPITGHQAFLLAADDSSGKIPTAELVEKYYGRYPWPKISMDEYLKDNPYRSLLDCRAAKQALGWQPKYSFRDPASGLKF
jgi:UDP-glucose 4-epimerase